jgi:hypothetical protein
LCDLSVELKGLQAKEVRDAPRPFQDPRKFLRGVEGLVSMQENLVGCSLDVLQLFNFVWKVVVNERYGFGRFFPDEL